MVHEDERLAGQAPARASHDATLMENLGVRSAKMFPRGNAAFQVG
jgi:hypothetical protein